MFGSLDTQRHAAVPSQIAAVAARFREAISRALTSFSEDEIEALRHLAREARGHGRALAEHFAHEIETEHEIVGIWQTDVDGAAVVTVLTTTFDEALEERLLEVFARLADDAGQLGDARLDVFASDEPHPAPVGEPVRAMPAVATA